MIEVCAIPPLATVQDLGRDGHWFQGLGRAGVMDSLAHRAANILLGNDDSAATLEIPLTPARFRFTKRQAFAIAGAVCGATLADRALPRVWAGHAEAGDCLDLGGMTSGARIYLALSGGIDVPKVLGSRSTQLREAFGGFHGRVLATGDQLRALSDSTHFLPKGGFGLELPRIRPPDDTAITLRALVASKYDDFSAEAHQAFWSTPFVVTPQSNRQGYRLDGVALNREGRGELRSHGIVPGIVQVPGSGAPIIQLADSATMGGYPKIAAVISADLWRLGQARPGDSLRFEPVDLPTAAEADREINRTVESWRSEVAKISQKQRSWT